MNLLRKVIGDLMGQVDPTTDRKPRPGRNGLGSRVEQLETRAMLSQVHLAAPIVGLPPSAVRPAVIVSTQAPLFNVHASPLDVTEGGGQIGVQLVDKLGSRLST